MSTSIKLTHAQAATPCSECKKNLSSHIPCHNGGKSSLSKDDDEALMAVMKDKEQHSLMCTDHKDLASCHCKKCNIPVCIKCVTGKHQGHKMVELEIILQEEKQALRKNVNKLEKDILPKLIKWKEELNSNHEKFETNIQHIKNNMEEEKRSFQKEIDRCYHEKRKDIESIRDSQSAVFYGFSNDIEMKISYCKQKLSEYRNAIEKNSLLEIYDIAIRKEPLLRIGNKLKLQDAPVFVPGNIQCVKDNMGKLHVSSVSSVDTAYKMPRASFCCITSFAFICAFLAVVLAYMTDQIQFFPFSPLVDIQILKAPTIESMFKSPLKEMPSIIITKEGDVWLGGDKSSELVMVNIKGQILRRRKIKISPKVLAVTDNGDIIILSESLSVIRLISDNRRQMICDGDFDLSVGVSVTSSQQILVCTINGRILLSNGDEHNCKQIYKGTGVFSAGYAVESRNGNIYISDQNKSTVVIVGKDGHILSTLTHTTEGRRLGRPSGMVVDTMGNILCSDWIYNCVYIIDKNQQMRVLIEPSDGITSPRWLAVDNEKNLWITSSGGTVSVVKYLDL